MKILEIKSLALNDIKVIKYGRYSDERGYFTELFRMNDFLQHEQLKEIFPNFEILQQNESSSKPGVARGLHFQWNPYMGKLVRTVQGRMVDVVLDIRKNSPTLGKAIMYDMPTNPSLDFSEWIWVPAGFAHGNFFTEETTIEYLCTGQYSPGCEAGISPLSDDIDWSLCDKKLKKIFDDLKSSGLIISEKDKLGISMNQWLQDQRSDNFI